MEVRAKSLQLWIGGDVTRELAQRHHLARRRPLDRQPFGREPVVVKAADAAIGRQARIRRNPGAGDEQDAPRTPQQRGHAIEHGVADHAQRLTRR